MNSILNEITYMDGRDENGSTMVVIDTPAKLKLRNETNQSIRRNLSYRRSPRIKSSTFSIPSAAMAMPLPGDTSEVEVKKQASNDYTTSKVLTSAQEVGAKKKLRLESLQFAKMRAAMYKEQPFEKIAEVPIKKEEAATVVPPVVPVTPKVEKEVTSSVPSDTKTVSIDDVRQKAYEKKEESTPVIPASQPVEKELDDFGRLQKVTEEYKAASQVFSQTQDKLNRAEETLKNYRQELKDAEKEVSKQQERIASHQGAIDTAEKDIETIEKEKQEILDKIRKKIVLISEAKERKEQERRKLEEETKKIEKEAEDYHQKINTQKSTLVEMNGKVADLSKKEQETLERRMEKQREKDALLEIFNAIELPPEIEEKEDKEAVLYSIRRSAA